MMVYGEIVTERVIVVECRDELDPSAYWNLDFDGTLLPAGAPLTLLYNKTAWPTYSAARKQFEDQREADLARQVAKPRPRSRRGKGGEPDGSHPVA